MSHPPLVLASASPRRRQLLAGLGLEFEIEVADIDETPAAAEAAPVYVERMALEKARAVAARRGDALVLGSDTSVVVDGEILGKPRHRDEGLAMLARLSGRTHQVLTAVALVAPDGEEGCRLSVSEVTFRPLSEAERVAYWATGEPADKAGGYAIQGRAAIFVSRLEGSFSGVMGLPLFDTAELLRRFGLDVCRSWIESERG